MKLEKLSLTFFYSRTLFTFLFFFDSTHTLINLFITTLEKNTVAVIIKILVTIFEKRKYSRDCIVHGETFHGNICFIL